MAYRHLLTRQDGASEIVLLDRPDVRNALDDEVIGELTDWATTLPSRRDVRAVILGGTGTAFCAGADVTWMARTVELSEAENLRDAQAMARLFAILDCLPVVLVGRVHGAALGGGAGLAAVCDIVVADEQATFGFTEVKLGIVPAVISPFVLAKIGRSAARELFLSGVRFTAARAKEIGLVHAVVPRDQLDATVSRYLNEILTSAPEAIATAKQLIADVWPKTIDQAAGITARAIALRRISPEGQEGLRAFLARRTAAYVADAAARTYEHRDPSQP